MENFFNLLPVAIALLILALRIRHAQPQSFKAAIPVKVREDS